MDSIGNPSIIQTKTGGHVDRNADEQRRTDLYCRLDRHYWKTDVRLQKTTDAQTTHVPMRVKDSSIVTEEHETIQKKRSSVMLGLVTSLLAAVLAFVYRKCKNPRTAPGIVCYCRGDPPPLLRLPGLVSWTVCWSAWSGWLVGW